MGFDWLLLTDTVLALERQAPLLTVRLENIPKRFGRKLFVLNEKHAVHVLRTQPERSVLDLVTRDLNFQMSPAMSQELERMLIEQVEAFDLQYGIFPEGHFAPLISGHSWQYSHDHQFQPLDRLRLRGKPCGVSIQETPCGRYSLYSPARYRPKAFNEGSHVFVGERHVPARGGSAPFLKEDCPHDHAVAHVAAFLMGVTFEHVGNV